MYNGGACDRTESSVIDKVTGVTFKTTKGAPHVILKLVHNSSIITQVLRSCVTQVRARLSHPTALLRMNRWRTT